MVWLSGNDAGHNPEPLASEIDRDVWGVTDFPGLHMVLSEGTAESRRRRSSPSYLSSPWLARRA